MARPQETVRGMMAKRGRRAPCSAGMVVVIQTFGHRGALLSRHQLMLRARSLRSHFREVERGIVQLRPRHERCLLLGQHEVSTRRLIRIGPVYITLSRGHRFFIENLFTAIRRHYDRVFVLPGQVEPRVTFAVGPGAAQPRDLNTCPRNRIALAVEHQQARGSRRRQVLGEELPEPSGAARYGPLRHVVQNVFLVPDLLGRASVRTVLIDEIVLGRTRNEELRPEKLDPLQLGEQTDRKRHTGVVGNRAFDYSIALPVDSDSIFHDLHRGIQAIAKHLDITAIRAECFHDGLDHVLRKAVQAHDRAEVEIVVPRNQRVISNSTQASALAEEEDNAMVVEDLFRFEQQLFGVRQIHRRDRPLDRLHEGCIFRVVVFHPTHPES